MKTLLTKAEKTPCLTQKHTLPLTKTIFWNKSKKEKTKIHLTMEEKF